MNNTEKIKKSLNKRYRKEKRFRLLSLLAVLTGFACLFILLVDMIIKALPALIKQSLQQRFPTVRKRSDKRALMRLISVDAEYQLRDKLQAEPQLLGETVPIWLLVDDDVDTYLKSDKQFGRVSQKQIAWITELEQQERFQKRFNYWFFQTGDSREPELAGILGAVMGSFYTLLVTLLLSFPIGVMAAVYLEEFAPRNRWIDLIEVNINNLAAVPSIVQLLLLPVALPSRQYRLQCEKRL